MAADFLRVEGTAKGRARRGRGRPRMRRSSRTPAARRVRYTGRRRQRLRYVSKSYADRRICMIRIKDGRPGAAAGARREGASRDGARCRHAGGAGGRGARATARRRWPGRSRHQREPRYRHRGAPGGGRGARPDRRAPRHRRHRRGVGDARGALLLGVYARRAARAPRLAARPGAVRALPRHGRAVAAGGFRGLRPALGLAPLASFPGAFQARRCATGARTSATSSSATRRAAGRSPTRTRRCWCCSPRRPRPRSPMRARIAASSARGATSRR